MAYWTDFYGRKWLACECLIEWMPWYEKVLLKAKVIRECIDAYQLIGDASASAGFHAKGGCYDIAQDSTLALWLARQMGSAGSARGPKQNMIRHQHAVLKGCPHAVQGAKNQITEIERGGDGLVGSAPDEGPRDGIRWPLPTWREGIEWAKTYLGAEQPLPDSLPATVRLSDPRITESSALAFSALHKDLAYTLNDENGPLYAIQPSTGKTVGTFTLRTTLRDPEALAMRGDGSLWVADIGDNDGNRKDCALYVLAEPGAGSHGWVDAERYAIAYPNGPRNAEALLIHPITKHRYIISKEAKGNLYRSKVGALQLGKVNVLEHVGTNLPAYVSDACFTVDGRFVLVRQKGRPGDVVVLDGTSWKVVGSIPVPTVAQPESITMNRSGRKFFIGSEGKNSPLVKVPLPEEYCPKVEPAPAGLLELSKFKRTRPTGEPGHPDEVYPLKDFRVPVEFRAPVDGVTTKGTKYARDELREEHPDEWSSRDGKHHKMWGTCRVTEIPGWKVDDYTPGVVFGQMHDDVDDVVILLVDRLGRLILEEGLGKGDGSNKTVLATGYRLGDEISYLIDAHDDGIDVTVNGRHEHVDKVVDDAYYKAGCYLRGNTSNATGEGAVTYTDLGTSHE